MSKESFNLTALLITLGELSKSRKLSYTFGRNNGKPCLKFAQTGYKVLDATIWVDGSNIACRDAYTRLGMETNLIGMTLFNTNETLIELLAKTNLMCFTLANDEGTKEAKRIWEKIDQMDFELDTRTATRVLNALIVRKNFVGVDIILKKFPHLKLDNETLFKAIDDGVCLIERIFGDIGKIEPINASHAEYILDKEANIQYICEKHREILLTLFKMNPTNYEFESSQLSKFFKSEVMRNHLEETLANNEQTSATPIKKKRL